MDDHDSGELAALESALRPLRFAARRNFANLSILKDVERTMAQTLEGVGASSPSVCEVIDQVRQHMVGFDGLNLDQKRDRVSRALHSVEQLTQPTEAPGPRQRPLTSSSSGETTRASPTSKDLGPEIQESLPNTRALFLAAPRVLETSTAKRVPLKDAQPEHLLSNVIGVGPKTAEKLQTRGLETIQDALFFLPTRYEDRSELRSIEALRPGDKVTVQGIIAASAMRAGKRRMWELALRDGTGVLSVRFFRFSAREMEARYPVGTRVRAFGAVTFFGSQRQMAHPDLEVVYEGQDQPEQTIHPLYPDVDGLPPRTLRRILQSIAEHAATRVHDPLPSEIRERNHLAPLAPAVRAAHLPEEGGIGPALHGLRRRLAFDELLYLQLALTYNRTQRERDAGLAQDLGSGWAPLAKQALPFELTGAQARVLDEIAQDMASSLPMSRLVQGDVGSGKTAVALLAAAMLQHSQRQACLLAPTEILAEQHARSAHSLLTKLGLQAALLTGSTPTKARRQLLRALERGDVHLLIGTHALLEPDVGFKDLGLVIVDEQHRFGVDQRAKLLAKREGPPPDVLVMTATPIPRTLTLSLYGDLRVSVIDELPPGRSPTETRVYSAREVKKAYSAVKQALDDGRQAYVVFPLVEASDQLELKSATEAMVDLSNHFAPHRVGLLHGKMRSDEKSSIMQSFKNHQLDVLVATTVIEVGVDVPNATVMVIEEADRFGLSQLHQLRGRVGRGRHQGLCLLIAGKKAGTDASERLSVMAETQDGFEIAQRDLEIRGPGEVLGTKQSGLPDLMVADLVTDGRLLEAARIEAEALLRDDLELEQASNLGIRAELYRRFSGKLARIQAG